MWQAKGNIGRIVQEELLPLATMEATVDIAIPQSPMAATGPLAAPRSASSRAERLVPTDHAGQSC